MVVLFLSFLSGTVHIPAAFVCLHLLSGDGRAAGKKLQGYMAWKVDPEWKELEVSYKDDLWTDSKPTTFVVTPDELTA